MNIPKNLGMNVGGCLEIPKNLGIDFVHQIPKNLGLCLEIPKNLGNLGIVGISRHNPKFLERRLHL